MKRIIVCCDGTWNDADSPFKDTNVFRIARAIHGQDGAQIVFHLKGVGTAGLKIGELLEGVIGLGVEENIQSAYMFIAQNDVPDDEIFLFGFSRGAYTARSLAGFISACRLLKRQRLDSLSSAWVYYCSSGPHDPAAFMQACSTDCHCRRSFVSSAYGIRSVRWVFRARLSPRRTTNFMVSTTPGLAS